MPLSVDCTHKAMGDTKEAVMPMESLHFKPDPAKAERDQLGILRVPIIGHRYWLRRGTAVERAMVRSFYEEYCGFCGTERPVVKRWTKCLVEIVPLNNPITHCCKTPEEPPPGSFAVRVISGSVENDGGERWLDPSWIPLLSPV